MTSPPAAPPPYVRYFPADLLHLPHWDEHQAVVSTAEATWALFWVTAAAAIATLAAVIAAFVVPALDRRARRREERIQRLQVDRRAVGEMRRARELMTEVSRTLETVAYVSDEVLWSYNNRINIIRRLLEKYLGASEGTGELDRLEMQTVQSLYEVAEACKSSQTGGRWHAEDQRNRAVGTIARAQERAADVFAYLDGRSAS